MNSMLQRHCARYIYVVPEGLRELMSDISREVLRSQPEEIHTFIADYLDALLITRENARVAARLVQSITEISEQIIDVLENTGIGRDDAEYLAKIMHETFKKYIEVRPGENKPPDALEEEVIEDILATANIPREELDDAATVIQEAFKKFKERKERERHNLIGVIDWRVAARSVIHLYRQTGVSVAEANRAATMIKAAYKGYYTRQMMKRIAENASTTAFEQSSLQEESDGQVVETFDAAFHQLDKESEHGGDSDDVTKEVKSIIEEMLLAIESNIKLIQHSKTRTTQAEGVEPEVHRAPSTPVIDHEYGLKKQISNASDRKLMKESDEEGAEEAYEAYEAFEEDPTAESSNILEGDDATSQDELSDNKALDDDSLIGEENILEQDDDIHPGQEESFE